MALPSLFSSCSKKADTSLEYLLVRFDGDENWSLMNDKGEVVKRNELQSRSTPTMVTDGIFIAEHGYYKVDDLENPVFADKKFVSGTEFSDGVAIAVSEVGAESYFNVIDTEGETLNVVLAEKSATRPEYGFFYTKKGRERIVASIKGVFNPEGNVILGPNRTGALFYKKKENGLTDYNSQIYRAYEGAFPNVEEVWETEDDLINFDRCHEMGYLVKRTEDGHAVFLDLDLKELFSHPDVYVNQQYATGYVAYLGDKVIYNDRADAIGKYGVMKTDGTVLLAPEYSDIAYLSDGIFIARKATEEYAYMIRENGELVVDEPMDFGMTEIVLRSLKPQLGKYFILYNKDNEVVFIDAKGNKLELPGKLSNGGCLGNEHVEAEVGRHHGLYFIND